MRKILPLTALLLLFSAGPLPAKDVPANSPPKIGTIAQMQGHAIAVAMRPRTATPAAQRTGLAKLVSAYMPAGAPRAMRQTSALMFLDQISTGTNARIKAVLKDDTELVLGADAELILDTVIFDPRRKVGKLALKIVQGAFLYTSGKIAQLQPDAVTLVTPVAQIGIRGTQFWGGRIDDGYGIFVRDGRVTVTTATGSVDLGPGEGVMIYPDGSRPMGSAVRWGADKIRRALATVTFR